MLKVFYRRLSSGISPAILRAIKISEILNLMRIKTGVRKLLFG
jgi:hypothetical protein